MSMKARPSTRSALAGSGTAPADRVGSQPRSRCRLRTGEQRSSDEVRCMSPVIQDSPKAIPGSIPHPLVRCPSIGRLKEEYRRFGIRPLRQHDKRSCDAVNPSTVARPAGALVQLLETLSQAPVREPADVRRVVHAQHENLPWMGDFRAPRGLHVGAQHDLPKSHATDRRRDAAPSVITEDGAYCTNGHAAYQSRHRPVPSGGGTFMRSGGIHNGLSENTVSSAVGPASAPDHE